MFSFYLEESKSSDISFIIRIEDKRRNLYADTLKEEISDPHLAKLLLQSRTTSPLTIFPIPHHLAADVLDRITKSYPLFWKKKELEVKLDFPFDLILDIHPEENQIFKVDGILRGKSEKFSIIDCEFLCKGNPPYFIKDQILYRMAKNYKWSWIAKVFPKATYLSGAAWKDFEEDREELLTNDLPYFQMGEQKKEGISQVFPILQLKDQTGAFADLLLDYPGKRIIPFHSSKATKEEKLWEDDLLETDFVRKDMGNSHYYCPMDQVAKSLLFLMEIGWKILDFKNREVILQGNVHFSLKMDEEECIFNGGVSFGEEEIGIKELASAAKKKSFLLELDQNRVGLLDWRKLPKEELSSSEFSEDEVRIPKRSVSLFKNLVDQAKKDQATEEFLARLYSIQEIETVTLDEKFKGVLHSYQQQGVNWLSFLYQNGFHGILADEMGLGKTVQVLAFFSQTRMIFPHLVIMPTSLLFNWKRECKAFIPHVTPYVHAGIDRLKDRKELEKQEVIFVSYAIIRRDRELFSQMKFGCIVLDEAHLIKNARSQIFQAVNELQATFKLALTGTPIENSLGDLWALFHFLLPELLESKREFTSKIANLQSDPFFTREIKQKVSPFILRRRKSEIDHQFPPKVEQVVWIEMEGKQKEIYEEWLLKTKKGLLRKIEKEGVSTHQSEIFEALLRLRQICCHPLLVDSELPEEEIEQGKLERVLADIRAVASEGHKVLVFSQFTEMLKIIRKEIEKEGISHVYLDGQTKDREKVVESFQNDPHISLFLISLKAGGVGLNLTSADYVFIYEPWWNEAVENQAIDRAHRLGRKGSVIVKRYIFADSIEEKIMDLKKAKSALASDILHIDSENVRLTFDTLKVLLSSEK